MERFQYSTTGIDAARRFDYWNDVVCRHCVPAASRLLSQEPFDGELAVHTIGAVDISTMTAPLHHWSRDSQHLRRGPHDDLWIAYMAQGKAVVTQSEHQIGVGAGDMVLYDGGRPFTFLLEAQRIYLLRLPRRSLLQRCPGAERLTAHGINAAQAGASPLRSLIEQAAALDFDRMRPGAASQFGSTLLDLVAVMLEVQMCSDAPPREHDLYARAVSYIERHFEDPSINLNSLAQAHSVSSRSVTRAFARRDKTPMALVWQLRLEASRRALSEGRSRSVTEAAFDHGFSDVSHFSRAFRKYFGCTPHTLLMRH
jgi:AraC-like DNA-binding protein